ncbi:hemin uptake protein HemP [uncultured Azonexus sp.]|uniref:hemin uptake protein HemP n=1 Tax=uncultured Azonexus sp. TaxID=520307 RepID=UPI0026191C71|nr:hemin uptake protein HemP [uncultured Azonexus sp.]
MNTPPKPAPDSSTPPASNTSLPRVDSGQILQGANTVEIEHAGQRYLLRVTRENKLILTK